VAKLFDNIFVIQIASAEEALTAEKWSRRFGRIGWFAWVIFINFAYVREWRRARILMMLLGCHLRTEAGLFE